MTITFKVTKVLQIIKRSFVSCSKFC